MDLESYRTANALTYRELTEKLRINRDVSNVRRIALGLEWPRPEIIGELLQATDGAVTLDAMFERYQRQRVSSAA